MSSVFAPGRVAIVTGAAGGIGFSVVTRCSNHGMRVCLLDVNDEALAQARAKAYDRLQQISFHEAFYRMDIGDLEAEERAWSPGPAAAGQS